MCRCTLDWNFRRIGQAFFLAAAVCVGTRLWRRRRTARSPWLRTARTWCLTGTKSPQRPSTRRRRPAMRRESERFPNVRLRHDHGACGDVRRGDRHRRHAPALQGDAGRACGRCVDGGRAGRGGLRCAARLVPEPRRAYQAKYDEALSTVTDAAAKAQGVALGTEVAAAILADRANDGRATVLPAFVPGTEPGQFRGVNPIGRTNQYVKPFSLMSASQFRAPGPPALDSATYTADFNETRDLGGATSTARTVEQTEAARFHTEPPPRFWTRNLRQFAMSQPTLAENAQADGAALRGARPTSPSPASRRSTTSCGGGRPARSTSPTPTATPTPLPTRPGRRWCRRRTIRSIPPPMAASSAAWARR